MVNLFNHTEELNVYVISGFMVFLILTTIGLEFGIHYIDKRLKQHSHYYRMIAQLYQELMILGLISFLLILIRAIAQPPEEYDVQFEFCHLWIFIMAIFYIVNALTCMLRSRAAKRHWDHTGHMRLEDLLRRFDAPDSGVAEIKTRHWLRQWLFGRGNLIEEMEWHIMKDQFLRHEELPVDFDFAKYLRSCMSLRVTRQLHIPNSTWFAAICMLTLNVIRAAIAQAITDADPDAWNYASLWTFFVLGYLLFFCAIALLMIGRRAKDLMMARAGCHSADTLRSSIEFIRTHPIQKSFASGVSKRGASFVRVHTSEPDHSAAAAGGGDAHGHGGHVIDPLDSVGILPSQPLSDDPKKKARSAAHHTLQIRGERNKYVVSGVFPYDSPRLFAKAMEILSLFQCFYLALGVLVNISGAINLLPPVGTAFYLLSGFIPQFAMMFIITPAVLKNYIFIEAVGKVDREVINQTLAGMQSTHLLKIDLGRRLHALMEERGGEEQGLQAVWSTIDELNTGYVTRNQFRDGLAALQLTLSDKQLHRLFRAVETGQNGTLSERDFRSLVFLNEIVPPSARTAGISAGAGGGTGSGAHAAVSKMPPPALAGASIAAAAALRADSKSSSVEEEVKASSLADRFQFARCFGGQQIDCFRCGKAVQLNKVFEHAETCTPAVATKPVWQRPPARPAAPRPPPPPPTRNGAAAAAASSPKGYLVPASVSPVNSGLQNDLTARLLPGGGGGGGGGGKNNKK